MNDFYLNKYLLGELTMEDYYDLAKHPAAAALRIGEKWGNFYANCHDIAMTGEDVVFRLDTPRLEVVHVPRSSKVKIKRNKVTTKDNAGKDVAILFYNLVPTPNPLKKRTRK